MPTKTAPAADTTAGTVPANFTVGYPALVDALAACQAAVRSRPGIRILGGVLFDARTDGTMTVSAFDYELSVSVAINAHVETPGRLVLGFADMQKYLRAVTKTATKTGLSSNTVWITAGSAGATMVSAGFTFPIETFTVDDYPQLPAPADDTVTVDTATFTALTKKLAAIIDRSVVDTIPMIGGINARFTPGHVTLTSTDRFRLGCQTIPAQGDTEIAEMLIPAAPLGAVAKLFPANSTIAIGRADNNVSLTAGPVQATIRLIDAQFVKYDALIPDLFAATLTVDKKTVAATLAVLTATGGKTALVKLSVDETGGRLAGYDPDLARLVHAPQLGGHTQIDGADNEYHVKLRAGFLDDALRSIDSDTVTIGLNESNGSITKTLMADSQAGLTDPNTFRHVVMPGLGDW